jgi:hypothetical protein
MHAMHPMLYSTGLLKRFTSHASMQKKERKRQLPCPFRVVTMRQIPFIS